MARKEYKKTSPYSTTPQTTWYLSYYEPRPIPKDSSDVLIELDSKYNLRPDILSFDLYGTTDYWWTFSVLNQDVLFDPIYDFNTGKRIYYATKQRLTTLLG